MSKIDLITTYPAVIIFVTALIVVSISKFLQNKFIDQNKLKSLQSEVKEKNKIYQEAAKSKDVKRLEKAQQDLLDVQSRLMQEMMPGQTKLMFISLPIFLVIFYILGNFYEGVAF
ncbi:MAG: EMC3/TMCO1 family protein, partial [Candidatus ainarchaeum sp.]|nr:EMC3/TMCO1 family protein [Candidatus ainarchaeum sp.]